MRNLFDQQSSVTFGSKAETLDRLRELVKSANILPAISFSVSEWQSNGAQILDRVATSGWFSTPLIVRSSSRQEDTAAGSLAGKFLSIPNALGHRAVKEAINNVIASYGDACGTDQVLIQPMLQRVTASGVAFGFDPNTGSPYRVVNLDDFSMSTDSVTSGSTNSLRTFYCLRHSSVEKLPPVVGAVCALIDELENLFGTCALDIEFAVTEEQQLFLLQCRPLSQSYALPDEVGLREYLERIAQKIELTSKRHPYLLGSRSVYGVMPDWNPAEIIGVRPRPLALSLYQELITDNIWAYQRDNYGYRNLRSFPLMLSLGGQPYIDVRVDFNSFVPAELDEELGERLVNYYLDSGTRQ